MKTDDIKKQIEEWLAIEYTAQRIEAFLTRQVNRTRELHTKYTKDWEENLKTKQNAGNILILLKNQLSYAMIEEAKQKELEQKEKDFPPNECFRCHNENYIPTNILIEKTGEIIPLKYCKHCDSYYESSNKILDALEIQGIKFKEVD